MRIDTRSPLLKSYLEAGGLFDIEPFDVDDAEGADACEEVKEQHPDETSEQIAARAGFRLTWKYYGAKREAEINQGVKGAEATAVRNIVGIHDLLRRAQRDEIPALTDAIVKATVASYEQASETAQLRHQSFIQLKEQQEWMAGKAKEWEADIQGAAVGILAEYQQLYKLSRKLVAVLAFLLLMLIAATIFSRRSHAQLDGLKISQGASFKQWAGGIARLTFAGAGVSCVGWATNTVTCTISSTSPGGADTQIQFNNAGAFGGSANLTWTTADGLSFNKVNVCCAGTLGIFPDGGGNGKIGINPGGQVAWFNSNASLPIGGTYDIGLQRQAAGVLGTTNGNSVYGGAFKTPTLTVSGLTSKSVVGTNSNGELVTGTAFTGDAGAGGTLGAVPAPAAGDAAAGKFLKADGTWATGAGMVYPGAGVAVSTGAAWGTSKASPTGDIVGTSDTQALTNKNLTGAGNTFPTFNQNTTGTASNVTGTVAVANGGTGATTAAAAATAMHLRPNTRIWGEITTTGTVSSVFGDTQATGGTITYNVPAAGVPKNVNLATLATGSASSTINGNLVWRTGNNLRFQASGWFPAAGDYSDSRVWLGLTDQAGTVMDGADDPAGNYAGFRFSTFIADTNWYCTQKDNVTQYAVTSSVAGAATTYHEFEIIFDDTAATISYYIDGVAVCGSPISGNHPPSASTNLRQVVTIQEGSANIRNFKFGWLYAEADR